MLHCALDAPLQGIRVFWNSTQTNMKSTNSTRVKAPDSSRQALHGTRSSALMMGTGESPPREASVLIHRQRLPQLDLRRSTKIATWNVLTLNGTGYQVAITRELARLNIDIACLTEARIPGSGLHRVENHTFLYSGGTQHIHGVAMVLAPSIASSLLSWHAVNDRLLTARLRHRHGHMTLVAAYAPTEDGTDIEKDAFYDSLADIVHSVPPHDELVIAGDLNAVSGTERAGFEQVIGPFGSGIRNDNSDRLLSFCACTGLAILGSWFQRPDIWRWTWLSNDGRTTKELDHILTRRRKDCCSLRVYRGAECPANTDHRIVVSRFKISLTKKRKSNSPQGQVDVEKLACIPQLQQDFSVAVSNRFSALSDLKDDAEDAWRCIRDNIKAAASEVIGYKHYMRKPWLSHKATDIIDQKREAAQRGDRVERNRLQKEFRKIASEDRESYLNEIADNAERALGRNDMKPIYRSIRILSGSRRSNSNEFPTKLNGKPCLSIEEALARWREYYEKALNHSSADPCPDLDLLASISVDEQTIPVDAPTLAEVVKAIMKLKNGRAPGSDGIAPELLKYSLEPTGKALHHLFALVWKSGKVPTEWKDGLVVSLYKGKGAKSDCSNYRPITLLSVPGKVFANILLARIEPLMSDSRRPQQSGFTAGRSTCDAILALRLLSDLHREFNRPLYVAYVDLKSAFDSVDREALWKAVRGIGVPSIILNLIQDLYSNTSSRIRVGRDLSEPFSTGSGVRQGCVLAPTLFCRAVDWLMARATHHSGINISGTSITDTDYADDIAAVDHDYRRLSTCLSDIEENSSKLGLHISWAKTKVQNIGAGPQPPDLSIDGQTVESVDHFTYLGSVLCPSGSQAEQRRRIGMAGATMNNLKRLWSTANLSLKTKLRLYTSLVLPVLLYAAETWTLTKVNLRRLQAFHMKCQRQILRVRWYDKVRNVAIHQKTNLPHIGNMIQRRRHSLFGHVARMNPNAPAHLIGKLGIDMASKRRVPRGWKRPRGRPRLSWLSQIRQDNGLPLLTSWSRAVDRSVWRVDATALPGYAL
jgi:hypothetical protein